MKRRCLWDLKPALARLEKSMVEAALVEARGNQSQAAKALNVSRDILHYTMKRYEINPDDYSVWDEDMDGEVARD